MEYTYHITIHLNARLQPVHRFELEDALQIIFEELEMGEVDGGGTLQFSTGEISSCDIEVYLKNGEKKTLDKLIEIIEGFGVPKRSELRFDDDESAVAIGNLEGMAVYLNGTQLSEEIYKSCDINYVIEKMNTLMENEGRMYSYWEGSSETALYFYGESYEKMLEKVQFFLDEYPLCKKCRMKQIA